MGEVRVVTAPNKPLYQTPVPVMVFLAGGITECRDWQSKVINKMKQLQYLFNVKVAILNPRREDFDATDENAEFEQIKWEHDMLEHCDIFSCFFANSISLQPITLYEFGKWAGMKPTVVTVQSGYYRERDVVIQSALDNIEVQVKFEDEAIETHAKNILIAAERFKKGV